LISGGGSSTNECKIKWSLITQSNLPDDLMNATAFLSPIFQGYHRDFGFCGPSLPFARWEWVFASVPYKFFESNGEFLCSGKGFVEVIHVASGRKLTLKVADVFSVLGANQSSDIGLSAKACDLLLGPEHQDEGGNVQPFAVKWKFVAIEA
jgi:hypothetical protein